MGQPVDIDDESEEDTEYIEKIKNTYVPEYEYVWPSSPRRLRTECAYVRVRMHVLYVIGS